MQRIIKYILIGISFGSNIYLLMCALNARVTLSRFEIISVLLMGALIGMTSLIFETERISFLLQLVMHLLLTAFVVWGCGYLNNWPIASWGFWFLFGGIYLAVWLVVIIQLNHDVEKINKVLFKKEKKE
ncbi:hypothetical protein JCM15457_608 [Liquorilactobacillus sucicola DSM 21376 = JCM 15457]|uniref:DUF3021 domain-containing protein n=1 Tax=Liquorilactobacillus sucicola DSM 21376 = JCM 15457 TaxID=1423806 RepID=A0A023CW40_9LACO|nr:DUF3021 domain-containing protein [Liquorilactobacillus sucicola]KRN05644.1 hypothetical protein FD15_GL002208 [Liquorilactobacillus sucicola DSM 21376 = JCM 15457]GAJ25730.1 hypothetical protein JCM15457_608 [Liquorilactobacillus sucicola DSM 21376 = JCM 15457]